MKSKTPIAGDSAEVTITLRRCQMAALEKLADHHQFTTVEELVTHAVGQIAKRQELTAADYRRIADELERGRPARQPKTPEPQTRSALARVIQVVQFVASGKHNCQSIAAELEVSSKTIARDLDLIQDRLGVRLDFDRARNVFHGASLDLKAAAYHVAALGLLGGLGAEVAK